jgi:hypothetical protein
MPEYQTRRLAPRQRFFAPFVQRADLQVQLKTEDSKLRTKEIPCLPSVIPSIMDRVFWEDDVLEACYVVSDPE